MAFLTVLENPPSIKAGQEFLVYRDETRFFREGGKQVPPEQLLLKKLTLVRWDEAGNYWFRTESGASINARVKNLMESKSVIPLIEDAPTVLLRERYLHRQIWPYGTFRTDGIGPGGSSSFGDSKPWIGMTISHVYHLWNAPEPVSLYQNGELDNPTLDAPHPWMVVFDPRRGPAFRGAGAPNSSEIDFTKFSDYFSLVAGEWHLEHLFSRKKPTGSMLHAAHLLKAVPGMTHLDAAWALGWPPLAKPLSEIEKLSVWTYPASPPSWSSVSFKGDRVIRYNPPHGLP